VRRYEGNTLILTTAYIVRPIYAHRTVVSNDCTDLNTAFRFEVMCIHQERNLVSTAAPDRDIGTMRRRYTYARVLAIDSELDLIALQITDSGIMNCIIHNNLYLYLPCGQPHGLIPIAEIPATDGEEVLLHAWPELRNDSTFWTISSYPDRRYSCLTSVNPYRYRMRLLELPGVNCSQGCSGGPVVNARLQAVGVMHGVLNNYGYAIPSSDVLTFLQRYHLVSIILVMYQLYLSYLKKNPNYASSLSARRSYTTITTLGM
jgi:hypothetical protein